jgi:hypothetical protein
MRYALCSTGMGFYDISLQTRVIRHACILNVGWLRDYLLFLLLDQMCHGKDFSFTLVYTMINIGR